MKKVFPFIILMSFVNSLMGQDEAVAIYNKAVNSTVTIETDIGMGSGFFVAENIIATNLHVMQKASYAYCYPANSTLPYEIEGFLAKDDYGDLILLKVVGLDRPSLKICRTLPTPGQKVYAIGSPKGMPCTISDGIVSAIREIEGFQIIQITAPISQGSSGGVVMNSAGDVIGVSTATLTDAQNMNFAVSGFDLQNLVWSMDDIVYPLYILSGNYGYYNTASSSGTEHLQRSSHFSLPEIIESYNDIIILNVIHKKPEIGDKCYFFKMDSGNPVMLGYGSVTKMTGTRCTIEMIESNESISKKTKPVILFEGELYDL